MSQQEKEKLTDAMVKRLPTPATGNVITYDGALPGFGARVTAGGARAFVFNYRVRGTGRERRYTIGAFPNWGTAAARERARELKRAINDGGDPLADLEAACQGASIYPERIHWKKRIPTMKNAIVVDLEHFGDRWFWRVKDCRLIRGPFKDRAEADEDASEVAPELIAVLAGR